MEDIPSQLLVRFHVMCYTLTFLFLLASKLCRDLNHPLTFFSSLQIGYLHLETKEWFASLIEADNMMMLSEDSGIQEKRKRMRLALCADANAAVSNVNYGNEDVISSNVKAEDVRQDDNGVFVGGFPVKRFSGMNLKAMAEEESTDALRVDTQVANRHKDRADSLNSFNCGIQPESTTKERHFSFSLEPYQVEDPSMIMDSASFGSIAELFEDAGRQESSFSSIGESAEIDSLFESSKPEYEGKFLETISSFLSDNNAPFQHVDLWVPMNVGGSSNVTTATSSTKVNGVIYGGQQETTIRLSHAGFITTRSRKIPHTNVHRLNEVSTTEAHVKSLSITFF